jgi:alpha/beta superfamily hydrolase
MKHSLFTAVPFLILVGCDRPATPPATFEARSPDRPASANPPESARPVARAQTLLDARRGFQTKLVRKSRPGEPAPEPPANLFRLVKFESPAGKLAAYVSPPPKDASKRPAIIWIFGGFGNDIGETAWERAPADNDQSASAYRKAGILMMYPSLRGGGDNPGHQEGFYGEVDDVLAAANFMARQDGVDPTRIYLGGHSTGGTLALLVAECTDRFRAIFSFGPVEDVAGYDPRNLPFNLTDRRERELRAPGRWLSAIKSPTFVFEGTRQGNLDSLQEMAASPHGPNVHFHPVRGATHFSLLAPVNRLLAAKVVADTGPTCNIAVTEAELNAAMRK